MVHVGWHFRARFDEEAIHRFAIGASGQFGFGQDALEVEAKNLAPGVQFGPPHVTSQVLPSVSKALTCASRSAVAMVDFLIESPSFSFQSVVGHSFSDRRRLAITSAETPNFGAMRVAMLSCALIQSNSHP